MLKIILTIVFVLICIALTVIVLLQEGKSRDLEPSAVWQIAIGARTKAVPWKVRLRSLQSSLPLQFFYWHWC